MKPNQVEVVVAVAVAVVRAKIRTIRPRVRGEEAVKTVRKAE